MILRVKPSGSFSCPAQMNSALAFQTGIYYAEVCLDREAGIERSATADEIRIRVKKGQNAFSL